jgi:AP-3 complex subunit mu
MIQSLFVLNSVGGIIIEKKFRGSLPRTVVDHFLDEVQHSATVQEVPPVITSQKNVFVHRYDNGLFFLAVLGSDAPPLYVIEFLNRVIETFTSYFGILSEETLKDHFVLAYELLDEMNDGGHPFNLEPNILEEMIAVPSFLTKGRSIVMGPGNNISSILPNGTLSQTPWRRQGVKYTTNEIFLDMIEEIDAIVEYNGNVIGAKVSGYVMVECRLSGNPDLLLKFHNPNIMDDISFHPCIRIARFERENVISFVPPDGKFRLLEYRSKGNIPIPINIVPNITFQETSGSIKIVVTPKNIPDKKLEDITITVQFAKDIGATTLSSISGSVMVDDNKKIVVWKMKELPKEGTATLEGNVSYFEDIIPTRPIITADFTVMMWAPSGLKIDSMTLYNEHYNHFKGVRSIAKGGKLSFRT